MTTQGQASRTVMMIRPVRFGFNPQTAGSNAFQTVDAEGTSQATQDKALAEFDAYVKDLRDAGIEVLVFEDTREPHTPDSIFPNNWVSFHDDGRVALYPMEAPNRRDERRADILERMQSEHGYTISEKIDFTATEEEGKYLEGTGSLIFDYANKEVYASYSTRTHPDLLAEVGQKLGFDVIGFHAVDGAGKDIYHTNVVMCLGHSYAVIGLDAIPDAAERERVKMRLEATGHEIIALSLQQLAQFAGNMYELQDADGNFHLVMSTTARASLRSEQVAAIEKHAALLPVNIETIERYGGGSARCMIAEVRLPKKG